MAKRREPKQPTGKAVEPIKAPTEKPIETTTKGRPRGSSLQEALTQLRADLRVERSAVFDWSPIEKVYKLKAAPGQPVELTDEALTRIREMAAAGRLKGTIAAHLGVSTTTFSRWLGDHKGENPIRYAWDAGAADFEQFLFDLFMRKGLGDGKDAAISLMFLSKAQFGWRDRPDAAPNTGPTININLPGPHPDMAGYLQSRGMTAVEDARGRPDVNVAEREPPMIDVMPNAEPLALPVPPVEVPVPVGQRVPPMPPPGISSATTMVPQQQRLSPPR